MVARKAQSKDIAISLQKHKGNKNRVAKELGVSRHAIQQRVKNDPIVRSAWEKYVKDLRKKIPNKRSIKVISDAMEAETIKSVRVDGGEKFGEREEVTEPDHYARLKANEQYLKINRLISTDEDKKGAEQHLHLHLESVKTKQLCDELAKQYKFLSGRDIDTEPLPDQGNSV